MTDPDRHRTGQPEVDALLDQADREHRAVAELVAINHAETLVSRARRIDLVAEHQALHDRYDQAEAELAAATASGDSSRAARARRVRDTCDRVGRQLREEMMGLAESGFERTGELLAQVRTAWSLEDVAREALTRSTREIGPREIGPREGDPREGDPPAGDAAGQE